MSEIQKLNLAQLENIIEENLLSFMKVGATLMHIRESRKYKNAINPETGESYETFNEYLKYRWEPSKGYLYRCITGAVIRDYLEKVADRRLLPSNEYQIRPLSKLATAKQVELKKQDPNEWVIGWDKAIEIAEGKEPTEKNVKKAVDVIIKNRKASNLPDPEPWAGETGIFEGDATSREWLDALPKDTFDLVLTDPPWAKENISDYGAVGRAALKSLKPGGVCAVYFGKLYLPEVIEEVAAYLSYEWMFCLYYPKGQISVGGAAVYDCWRPVGIFRKPGPFEKPIFEPDLIPAPREKGEHEWQQALGPARKFVVRYSRPNSVILDPFVGSGTFPLAAKLEGRKYLAFDKSKDAVKIARERLANVS